MKSFLRYIKLLMAVLLTVFLSSCDKKTDTAALDIFTKNQQTLWLRKLSQVVVSDVFSAPVTSRIYAYTSIAAYEGLRPAFPTYKSYSNQLKGLKDIPQPEAGKNYYFPISSIMAFTTVAKKIVFNGKAMADMENEYIETLKKQPIDKVLLQNSIAYGQKVGDHIFEWAKKDGYLQRTSLGGYMVKKDDESTWQPTPPDYMDAAEPNFKTLRPFTLDSAAQFCPVPPPQYSTSLGSEFYKYAKNVCTIGDSLTDEQRTIGSFWDDNPNTSVTSGHVTYFQQKLSPAGHWMHLTATIIEKENLDLMRSAEVFSKVAMGLFDGFISCWEAKYKYCLVRPETFINKYINKEWQPLIQTPPFPEYPSGHSVVSGSAATVLTHFFGDNYAYTDSIEAQFGLPIRQFKSFNEAAKEASISRLFGGIHYSFALTNGNLQGIKVGNNVVGKFISH
jgi:PAP2 superfamily